MKVYEAIFNCSPVAMLLVNEDSIIELANVHAGILFDYSPDELVGKNLDMLLPVQIKKAHPGLVKEYLANPISRRMGVGRNLYGVRKNGENIPVEIGLNPIQKDGKLYVMSSVIDITERLRAETRFKAAVQAAPCGMLMINQNGIIELANKKTQEIFGYEESELVGQPIEMLVPEEFKKPHPLFVKSYVANPVPRAMGIGRELFGRHKSGKFVPVEIGLQPVYASNETFVISSIVDITERKRNEEEIQEKSDEMKEFSYRTSHDLKSPLMTIGNLSDCILEDLEDHNLEHVKVNAERVKKLTVKLSKLIEDILTLTKADVMDEEKSLFSFDEYIKEVQEKYDYIIKENNVKIEGSFNQKKDFLVQKTRLTQVLDNLVSNSIKYFNKDSKDPYVRINVFNDPNKIYIQVEDNGKGIPAEKHNQVFGMFKRFDNSDIQGSGLGLYIIKKNMQKLNGHLSFESNPSGTTFYLEFKLI
ncbi:hypothetical protein C0V70_18435 [Bacteriovorax stolpii]|uniref:histidine kinase n=1 Tax=Bacteriovorax stolpii TaxID=960 RepID=A0A2K9NYI5_BACTC|nr:PAS domain-containing sensor histidine kinase [Bacteriovorax stolpii]AUO00046.1 hypothetical protein C0V70_18435 [Bacteriovorax stolpii]TDP54060.1 PAS/PAC sensor signal transduction histidine kinase [Bacteriovorax stolpii]